MSTLTLNLDERHNAVLTSLAAEQEMSKTALLRTALRLYQMIHIEAKRGRQLAFQNADGSFVSLVMLDGPMAAPASPSGLGGAVASSEADALRAEGWAVAVHNDYKLQGVPHTFWLFTKGDRAIKGEGQSDAEALAQVRAALASPPGCAVEGEAVAERYCNKCGYFGPDQQHGRPNGSGQCGYLSCLVKTCDRPPAGWTCTRRMGHEGPCAALQVNSTEMSGGA